MKDVIARLFERRILQYAVVYIGVAWGLMQFTQFIVGVFLFSPHWTKVAIFAALMLWPCYLLVVYRHARPGADSWGLPEKIGIPANLLIAFVVLFFMFRGEDLGAATTSITVADETGNVVEREVVKQEFRKRIVLFDFDADALADDDLWLTGLISDAVYYDTLGDDFVDAIGPNQFLEKLRRSGYPQLRNVPLALKREIADELHADWIFSGTIGKAGEQYTATVSLHSAGDGGRVAEDSYVADDVFDLVDRISADLKQHLEIPERDNVPDLPVREYFTSNEAALAPYGGARNLMWIDSDWNGALARLQEAVAIDPTFTLAQYTLASVFLLNNRSAEAITPIQAALTNSYRLPERAQFNMKADYYGLTQQLDKAWGVYEMWAELYPEDLLALQGLYSAQTVKNQRVEAIATLEKMYAINSGLANVLKVIAQLQSSLGNFDAARAALLRYVDRFPDDFSGLQGLAGVQFSMGEIDNAKRTVGRALLLEPTSTELLILSGRLDHAGGDFAAAEAGLKAALASAPSPAARQNAWAALHLYYRVQGQSTAAFDALAKRIEEAATFMPPLSLVRLRLGSLDAYFETGREAEARAIVEEYAPQLPDMVQIVGTIAELQVAVESGDIPVAEGKLAAVESLIAADQVEAYRGSALSAGAQLAALKVDEAERSIRVALQRLPGSAGAYVELGRVLQARGDAAGARAAVERALAMWSLAEPDFEPAAQARALLAAMGER
jgi:tetratricopeptide (TPR) repeat protein